jgi:hypothetical protein
MVIACLPASSCRAPVPAAPAQQLFVTVSHPMIIWQYPGVPRERIFPRSSGVARAWIGPMAAGISPQDMAQRLVVEARSETGELVELKVQDVGFLTRPDGTWFVARMELKDLSAPGRYDVSARVKATDLSTTARWDFGPPRSQLEVRADEFRRLDRKSSDAAITGFRALSGDPQADATERAFVLENLATRLAFRGECDAAHDAFVEAIAISSDTRRRELTAIQECLEYSCRGGDWSADACARSRQRRGPAP